LGKATKVQNLQVEIGTEIDGVQLSRLDGQGLDELALFAAERGVLIFRNQDLKDQKPSEILDIVRHFGRLHVYTVRRLFNISRFTPLLDILRDCQRFTSFRGSRPRRRAPPFSKRASTAALSTQTSPTKKMSLEQPFSSLSTFPQAVEETLFSPAASLRTTALAPISAKD
jgi:alpha-ketoglutarate-dependent taurine dioxygenase